MKIPEQSQSYPALPGRFQTSAKNSHCKNCSLSEKFHLSSYKWVNWSGCKVQLKGILIHPTHQESHVEYRELNRYIGRGDRGGIFLLGRYFSILFLSTIYCNNLVQLQFRRKLFWGTWGKMKIFLRGEGCIAMWCFRTVDETFLCHWKKIRVRNSWKDWSEYCQIGGAFPSRKLFRIKKY